MTCQNARSLVPSYLDGEISEEQAAPLRAHLLDCLGCRETAKAGTTVKRWFRGALAEDETVEVPDGFAARVARRAFAGDPGVLAPFGSEGESENGPAGSLLPFVLKLSTVAAGLLLVLSIGIQMTTLPSGTGMDALEKQPWELQEYPDDWPGDLSAPDASGKPHETADDPEAEAEEGHGE